MAMPIVSPGWTSVELFVSKCRELDVTVPPSIEKGFKVAEIADAHQSLPRTSYLDMKAPAVRTYVDGLTLRSVDHDRFYESIIRFKDGLLAEVLSVIGPELEVVCDELRPRFAEKAAPLVAAVREHGISATTTGDQILLREDAAAAEAYLASRRAISDIVPLVQLRMNISSIFNLSPTLQEQLGWAANAGYPLDHSITFAEGDNWDDNGGYYIASKVGGHLDWFALALGGLRLNSPLEVQRKIRSRPVSVVDDSAFDNAEDED